MALRCAAVQGRLQLRCVGGGDALLGQCTLRQFEGKAHLAIAQGPGRRLEAGSACGGRGAAAAQGGDHLVCIVGVADPAAELGNQAFGGGRVIEGGSHPLGLHQCGCRDGTGDSQHRGAQAALQFESVPVIGSMRECRSLMCRIVSENSAWAGAAAGWLAGGVGAAAYALHCPEMDAPFLAVWYVLGMCVPTALGAVAAVLKL